MSWRYSRVLVAQVAEVTECAMRGEIDFSDSLRQRVALLKGLDEACLQQVAASLPLTEGVEHLFEMLNKLGYKTAIPLWWVHLFR